MNLHNTVRGLLPPDIDQVCTVSPASWGTYSSWPLILSSMARGRAEHHFSVFGPLSFCLLFIPSSGATGHYLQTFANASCNSCGGWSGWKACSTHCWWDCSGRWWLDTSLSREPLSAPLGLWPFKHWKPGPTTCATSFIYINNSRDEGNLVLSEACSLPAEGATMSSTLLVEVFSVLDALDASAKSWKLYSTSLFTNIFMLLID